MGKFLHYFQVIQMALYDDINIEFIVINLFWKMILLYIFNQSSEYEVNYHYEVGLVKF